MRFLLPRLPCLLALLPLLPAQAPSQEIAPATPPAIELLLAAPRPLEAEKVRRRWSRVLATNVGREADPKGAFVFADGARIRGGRQGATWVLALQATPHPLPASATSHLDDEERQYVSTQSAWLRIEAEAKPKTDDERRQSYRLLGSIASALLADDVLAIGAADHGTFDVYNGNEAAWREQLAGDDPLAALQPSASTSLVLFVRAAPDQAMATLQPLFSKEFGTKIAAVAANEDKQEKEKEDDNVGGFLVSEDTVTIVGIGNEIAMILTQPPMETTPEALERIVDLRLRTLRADHRHLIRIECHGPADAASEQKRRRFVAKIAAAMHTDNVLGINWHCDRRLIPTSPALATQLRSDDPVAATLGEAAPPVRRAPDEAAMTKAIEQARASWQQAAAHHAKGGTLLAKFPFASATGQEHLWIQVTKIDDKTVHGTIANDPVAVASKKLGDAVACSLTELSDWAFQKDGVQHGGFTDKLLDAPPPANDKGGDPPKPAGK